MSEIQVFRNRAQNAPEQETVAIQRVAAYCRVSTLQEEQADSYETQCDYYKRLIEADPKYTLVDVYGDQGISGLSAAKRPEFQRMMRDCMDGKIDLIMTKSISRFARNLADCVNCVRLLRDKGIPVLFEKEGLNGADPSCEMILSVLASVAQEEVNNLSQNIRWSLNHRNANGDPARPARYGYRKIKDANGKKVWHIQESEAERVRLAFRMASQGQCYHMIITALNDMEIKEGTGVSWTQSRVYQMLKSEVYIGDILTNKSYTPDYLTKRLVKNEGQRDQYYIEGHHDAMIDKATFEHVAELIHKDALRTRGRGESK